MSAMNSNPHMAAIDQAGEDVSAEAMATLALAYEQRTLALIAYAQAADDETADVLWVDHIASRLGLAGAES